MMTIGAFSKRTGLPPKTLRYYEEVGLLVPDVRADNRYRQYEDSQVEAALLIHSLRQADVGIADIRKFMGGDRPEQERLLQHWREGVETKLLSLQIAKQFLQGFHPQAKHLRLVRWEEPRLIAWFPLLPGHLSPHGWFDSGNGVKDRILSARIGGRVNVCYVRYSETEAAFSGEIGYEVSEEEAKDARLAEGKVTEHRPTLFAAIECNPDRAAPCKPVFASIRACGFEPVGIPLRQYHAGINDRYTLLVPVMLQTN